MLDNKFFIFGSDAFSVQKKGEALVEKFQQYEIEIVISEATKSGEIIEELRRVIEALRTVSLFAPQKFIWYKNVSYLGDLSVGRSEEVSSWFILLQETLKDLPEVGFLLTAGVVDKRQKHVKWFIENSHAEICDELKEKGRERYVLEAVRKKGKQIAPEALERLLQRTGNHLATIDNELEKLFLLTEGNEKISIGDIDAVVVDLKDGDFFEAVDDFFAEEFVHFSRGIRRYFLYQGEGRPLLAALQNRVRTLIFLAYFYEQDQITHITKEVLEQLSKKYTDSDSAEKNAIFSQNPWYLGKLLPIAKTCQSTDWICFQLQLLEAITELAQNYREQIVVFERLYFYLKSLKKGNRLQKSLPVS